MPRLHTFYAAILIISFCLTICIVLEAQETESDSVVDSDHKLELVSEDFGLADGPAWNNGTLFVSDVKQSLIKSYVPASNQWKTVHDSDDRYSATFFSHGKLFLSNNSGAKIETIDVNKFSEGPKQIVLIDESAKPKKRPNDLVVDRAGGAYFTLTGQDQVVYVSVDGKSNVFSDKAKSPNGITMSPDNQTLYVAAYRPKKIIAIEIESPGKAGESREFATMDDGEALGADGMSIDSSGNVYCAGATDVWVWNPEGKLLDRIECPTRPINCTFGDEDLKTLYITGFGGLYKQRMHVAGVPANPKSESATK